MNKLELRDFIITEVRKSPVKDATPEEIADFILSMSFITDETAPAFVAAYLKDKQL